MERWWCLDCRVAVGLNTQARCERCDSDAVDTLARGVQPMPAVAVAEPEFRIESNTMHLATILRWYFTPESAHRETSHYMN
jgi:hypothetical protein